MKHGSRSTYVHHKCRCEECRGAQAAYQRQLYAAGKVSYKAKLNKRSRHRQQAAANWIKENRPDVWAKICETVA